MFMRIKFRPMRILVAAAVFLALAVVPAVWTDSGALHQQEQARPIFLGSTGGNLYDISSRYCCGGTLGCLVQDAGGAQYILSNNHILARSNLGTIGDPIIHPGLIDQSNSDGDPVCKQDPLDTIAYLADFVRLQFKSGRNVPTNLADAAIAMIDTQAVRNDGYILDVGTVSANAMAAFVGQAVQKSGRTTGQTFGQVAAVNVTVDVGYSTECGGPANLVARYINQIRITPGEFSASGDSGSGIVESGGVDPDSGRPRVVGLLFAGSSSSTLANPIGPILSSLAVTMVGGTEGPSPSPTATPTPTPTPGGAGQALVECITYSTTGGKDNNRHLNIAIQVVDDSAGPVSGAVVSIDLYFNGSLYGSGSATTGTNGQALFTVKSAPNGAYSVVVANVASSLTFEGTTPENLFRKGTDSSPDADCRGDAPQPSSGVEMLSGWQLNAGLYRASQVKARNEARLLAVEGVVGTGHSLGSDGKPVVEVYLDRERSKARGQIPAQLESVPVRVEVTGPFIAY